jgi:invasion protein IalB
MSGFGKQVLQKRMITVLAAGSLLTVAVGSIAQEGQQQQPGSPWVKLCGKVAVAVKGQTLAAKGQTQSGQEASQDVNACQTFQERLNDKDAQIIVAAAIHQQEGEDGERLLATVPLGVDLRTAPQAKIDGGKPVKLEYVNCTVSGCTAEAKVSADVVKAMKTGRQLVIEVKAPLGRPLSFELPLEGFAAAYDGQPSDSQHYQVTRDSVVNAIRARRAQQVQKAIEAMDSQQQSQQLQSQQPPKPQSQQAPPQVEPQR